MMETEEGEKRTLADRLARHAGLLARQYGEGSALVEDLRQAAMELAAMEQAKRLLLNSLDLGREHLTAIRRLMESEGAQGSAHYLGTLAALKAIDEVQREEKD